MGEWGGVWCWLCGLVCVGMCGWECSSADDFYEIGHPIEFEFGYIMQKLALITKYERTNTV